MMINQLKKFKHKLIKQNLCLEKDIQLYAKESEIISLDNSAIPDYIEKIFNELNIAVLLISKPDAPYSYVLEYFADSNQTEIIPQDSESRTFIHSIPVVESAIDPYLTQVLNRRKAAITKDGQIISHGSIGVEQAFVVFSSICFALFVKLFSDILEKAFRGEIDSSSSDAGLILSLKKYIKFNVANSVNLEYADINCEEHVFKAIEEAGKIVVNFGLVDSYFGNISYKWKNTLYISQTTSSLDELAGVIDPVKLDGTSTTGLTASSELSAHLRVIEETDCISIMHGHPKFSVIMSIFCPRKDFCTGMQCHKSCRYKRQLGMIPIVPGEVGTGKFGLVNTMPPALKSASGVIVYGHGVFTNGGVSFEESLESLISVENYAINRYFDLLSSYLNGETSAVRIILPSVFSKYGKEIKISGKTLKQSLESGLHNDILVRIINEDSINPDFLVSINDELVYDLYYPVADGDVITIIPDITGG